MRSLLGRGTPLSTHRFMYENFGDVYLLRWSLEGEWAFEDTTDAGCCGGPRSWENSRACSLIRHGSGMHTAVYCEWYCELHYELYCTYLEVVYLPLSKLGILGMLFGVSGLLLLLLLL